ncbi:MAG TPA: tetratricopeptide repeat protein [Bryobacteraceae bacterium]|nr:tetratricopeptide repeat protein [Bryobacteraceae bacterium]
MPKTLRIILLLGLALCAAGCRSARQYLDRGNQLFAAGRYEEAEINYRNAIQKDARSGEAQYRLGLTLLKLNKAAEAYQTLTRAVALEPNNMTAKVQLANLCLAAYASDPRHPVVLYKQARALTDALLAANVKSAEGLRLDAAFALLDNHPADAVEKFRHAVQVAPNSPEAELGLADALLRDNQPEEGERTAQDVIARHPQFVAGYQLLYSYYVAQRNGEKLEALLKSWSTQNPKSPVPILRLAAYYYAQKKPDEGERTLNTLLDRRAEFPDADLLVGDFHAASRDWDKALADYQRGESRDRTREATYRERAAGMLAASGHRDEALKAVDAILAKDAKNVFARSLKIQLLDQAGGVANLQNAASVATALAQDAPNNVRVQMLAGQALLRQGNLDQASARFTQAARIDGSSPTPQLALARVELAKRNYSAVLQHANAALALNQRDPSARLFRVIGLTGTRSYEVAKAEAEQLARDTKNAAPVEMQLGLIALGQKRYTEAEADFRKLYSENQGDIQPLAGLVNTYIAEHLPDRALTLVENEAQRTPGSTSKQALLVATAEAAGKPDVALAELQKMAAQNPSSAAIQIRIAQAQQQDGNLPGALQAAQRAQQLAPGQKGLNAILGSIQDQMGKYPAAIASYRKALAESPDDPVVLNNLAFLLADNGGNLNDALQMITKAVQKAPNSGSLRDTMAWVEMKRKNSAAALPILHALVGQYPDNATYHYHYAVALLDRGDRALARQEAQLALAKKPSDHVESGARTLLAQIK